MGIRNDEKLRVAHEAGQPIACAIDESWVWLACTFCTASDIYARSCAVSLRRRDAFGRCCKRITRRILIQKRESKVTGFAQTS